MDITDLPRYIAFKIFRQLPTHDLVRVSRVSSRFYDFSTIILGESKSIDFGDHAFRKLTSEPLADLIDLCAINLESIRFTRLVSRHNVEAFAQFSCPTLTELDLGKSAISNGTFGNLVHNNRNLKELTWCNLYAPIIYPDIISKNLQSLKLFRCDNGSFLSLTGRCPQLKRLEIETVTRIDGETFDALFAHCPNLEILILQDVRLRGNLIRFESMEHFWRLPCLRVLILGNDYDRKMTDTDLVKISTSFSKLEHLELRQLNVTNWGVANLASLKNLHTLTLSLNADFADIEDGIRRLAETGRLINAKFDAAITLPTFSALMRYCVRLHFLYVQEVGDVDTPEIAAEVIKSVSGPCKRDTTIRVLRGYQLWGSVQVLAALKELEAAKGHVVQFEYGYMDYLISVCDSIDLVDCEPAA